MKLIKAVTALSVLVSFNSFATQETIDSLLEQGYEIKAAALDGTSSSPGTNLFLQSPDKKKVFVCEADDNFPYRIDICDQAESKQ
ncbi:hypothetical protein ABKY54_001278 [Vibrio harveyi]|uniref:hypothetical protein n=1 Tax=Vibrio harveyi TaxID=669 RepID=UPI000682F4C2|nr:hypothetical protein [Vibrio harveyi]ELC3155469.1 hypothetical protein [Vibrio harveyi]